MKLRVKFITAILSSHLNVLRENIIQEASSMFVKAAEAEEKTTHSGKKTMRFAKNLITSFHENVVENSQSQEDESEAAEHHANEEGQ